MEFRFSLRSLVFLLFFFLAPAGYSADLPPDSLYLSGAKFINQDGKEISLASLRNQPVIATFIYTKCTYTCPLIVKKMKEIEKSMGDAPGLRFLLLSFDHENETPETMRQFMKEKKLDSSRWLMATGKNSGAIREIAALLDVKYKKEPSGEYSHSNIIVLLDKNGVKKFDLNGIAADPSGLLKAARQAL